MSTYETRLLIDGMLRDSSAAATFENVDPATEQLLGVVADGTEQDMDDAIAAARRAFDETAWSTDLDLRKRCLEQLQAALESEREELRLEVISECGTSLQLTYGPQVDAPIDEVIRWPLERMDTFPWERAIGDLELMGRRSRRIVVKEPVGVVGAITPWNFPFEIVLSKLTQSLVTGNTVVLKPAPDTPFCATRIGRLIAEQTDIPAGVVNIVPSSDHLRGEQLVTDPRVDMISFTGSTATGRRIMVNAADGIKRLFLELGGKSAQIYLDDCDLQESLASVSRSICYNAGQGCALPTRVLLPRSRYDEGLELIVESFGQVTVGDPHDPATIQGPLINARQRDRVEGLIAQGVEEGARLALGGGRPVGLEPGFWVEPTVFADVDNAMTIAQEEIFGPVVVVIAFDDDDDAVRISNDSRYGLSGSVRSASLDRALAVGRRIRTGTMSVNGGLWYGAEAPFGGYKSSGNGRQNGDEGFEQHLETKTIGLPI